MYLLVAIAIIFVWIMFDATMTDDDKKFEENVRRNREFYDNMRKMF